MTDDTELKKAQKWQQYFFASEKITNSLLIKARKSIYFIDRVLLKIYKNLKIESINKSDIIPTYTIIVEQKKNIGLSKLFSIQSRFDLLHAGIANIKFLAKSAAYSIYCLVFVGFFTSKTYTYPMKKRNLLAKKTEQFYKDINKKKVQKSHEVANRPRISTKWY